VVFIQTQKDAILATFYLVGILSVYGVSLVTFCLVLFTPCNFMLLTSLLLPCSQDGVLQVFNPALLQFWVVEGIKISCGIFEAFFMAQVVTIVVLSNVLSNCHIIIVLNKTMEKECMYAFNFSRFPYLYFRETKFVSLYCRKRNPNLSIKKWRFYQNLLQLFNECNSQIVYPTLTFSWTVICITSTYSVLKLYNVLHISMYIYMVSMSFDSFLVINFLYKYAGEVNETSKELIKRLTFLIITI